MNYHSHSKRILDLLLTTVFMVISMPAWTIIAGILLVHGKEIFFSQLRPGKGGILFPVLKFRTMSNQTDKSGRLLPDKNRITSFGRFLRRTSLDELPQLINVLKGEMSLVGPRPLLPQYLPFYNDYHANRHSIKPGITGWAQIRGRKFVSWEERFDLDMEYVRKSSFKLDLKVIFITLLQAISLTNADKSDEHPIPQFAGYGQV